MYIKSPIPVADLAVYEEQSSAARDGTLDIWLDNMIGESFLATATNAAALNALVCGSGQSRPWGSSSAAALPAARPPAAALPEDQLIALPTDAAQRQAAAPASHDAGAQGSACRSVPPLQSVFDYVRLYYMAPLT